MVSYFTSLFDLFHNFWVALQHGQALTLGKWNYVLLYIFSIVQGPTVKLLSGAASARHLLNLYLVFGVTTTATLTLDLFWYKLGHSGKMQQFLFKRIQKNKKYIQAAQRAMKKNGVKVIVLGKFATGLGVPIHIAAGLSNLKWQNWLPATILGEYLFTGMLILAGYVMAGSLSKADNAIRIIGTAITILIMVGVWLLLQSIVRKILSEKSPQPDQK